MRQTLLPLISCLTTLALSCACSAVTLTPRPTPSLTPSLFVPVIPATYPSTLSPTIIPTSQPARSPTAIPTRTPRQRPFEATATPLPTKTPLPTRPSNPTRTPGPLLPTPIARENTPVPVSQTVISPENANQVVELARWGKGNANDMAYSPDGSILAVASSLGIYFYDGQGKPVDFIETGIPIESLAFSPDGKTLATGSNDGWVGLWEWEERRLVRAFEADFPSPVLGLAFSPRGETLGYTQDNPEEYSVRIVVFGFESGNFQFVTDLPNLGSFQFSPDGSSIYITEDSGRRMPDSIKKYRIPDGSILESWRAPDDSFSPLTNLLVSSDETWMVASDSNMLYLWHLLDSTPYQSFEIPTDYSFSHIHYVPPTCEFYSDGGGDYQYDYALSPDNRFLAVNAGNGSLQLRRTQDGSLVASTPEKNIYAHTEQYIRKVLFHPTLPVLAILYISGPIELLEYPGLRVQATITGHTSEFTALAISPEKPGHETIIAAGASDNLLRLWNLSSGQRSTNLGFQADSLSFSTSGEYLAFGSKDWTVNILRLKDGVLLGPQPGHLDWVTGVAFLPDNRTLVTGSNDCTLKIWQVGDHIILDRTVGGDGEILDPIDRIHISSDGNWIVGDAHTNAFIFNTQSLELEILSNALNGSSLAISPDSHSIASSGEDGIYIWDLATQVKIQEWDVGGYPVEYSPDGRLLAAMNFEGIVFLVDSSTGQVLQTLDTHRGHVTDLHFASSGRFIVTASQDGTLRLWGIPSQ